MDSLISKIALLAGIIIFMAIILIRPKREIKVETTIPVDITNRISQYDYVIVNIKNHEYIRNHYNGDIIHSESCTNPSHYENK